MTIDDIIKEGSKILEPPVTIEDLYLEILKTKTTVKEDEVKRF
jgi:hypothetical protein